MQRRSMLKAAASFALLAAPRLAKASSPTTLRFVPVSGLVILDPSRPTGRATRNHGFLVFDTLYGLDETLNPQPQMVAGHTIEENGKRWTLTLREQLRFHDGEKVRGRDVVASIRRFGCPRWIGPVTDGGNGRTVGAGRPTHRIPAEEAIPAPCAGAGRRHRDCRLHHAGATGEHRSL